MTSKLTISIRFQKPNLRGDGRGGVELTGASDPKSVDVLVLEDVPRTTAEGIVAVWRRRNPGLALEATWLGPNEL